MLLNNEHSLYLCYSFKSSHNGQEWSTHVLSPIFVVCLLLHVMCCKIFMELLRNIFLVSTEKFIMDALDSICKSYLWERVGAHFRPNLLIIKWREHLNF
jgi:hypothetical protein